MASESGSIEYWREFFRRANADIIEVIECAILVASSDCPKELRSRRDEITAKLYASWVPRCLGCDRTEIQPNGRGEKNSKTCSSSEGVEDLTPVVISNFSYNDAEALTDEIEEENQILGEVLRIKEVLSNKEDESENVLFDSLRRLQLMALSVETIKVTDIGRAVNGLRRHSSKEIRHLVRALVEEWKVLVDEWISATVAIANDSPAPFSPDDVDQVEGLPSPPLDEGALWTTTQPASIQFSEFFDGMDDEGNFRINDDIKRPSENHEQIARKPQIPEDDEVQTRRQEQDIRKMKPLVAHNGHVKQQSIDMKEPAFREANPRGNDREERRHEPHFRERNSLDFSLTTGDKQSKLTSRPNPPSDTRNSGVLNPNVQEKSSYIVRDTIKQSKHSIVESGPGRPVKLSTEKKTNLEVNVGNQRKPYNGLQDRSKNSEDALLRSKLEAAKRKLHENYQQAENAKKQRTIQVMELQDIPKRAHINKQPIPKSKSNIRNLLNRRR